jgi:hypothetical protein
VGVQDDSPTTWTWRDDAKLMAELLRKVMGIAVGLFLMLAVPFVVLVCWGGCSGPS